MVHARFSLVLAALACAVLLCRVPVVAHADMIPTSADAAAVTETTGTAATAAPVSARD